jgi:hypothetical protein
MPGGGLEGAQRRQGWKKITHALAQLNHETKKTRLSHGSDRHSICIKAIIPDVSLIAMDKNNSTNDNRARRNRVAQASAER